MLATHVQSKFLLFILNATGNTFSLKRPIRCIKSNILTGRPGVHPPVLDLLSKHSTIDETLIKMATLFIRAELTAQIIFIVRECSSPTS